MKAIITYRSELGTSEREVHFPLEPEFDDYFEEFAIIGIRVSNIICIDVRPLSTSEFKEEYRKHLKQAIEELDKMLEKI